MVCLSNRDRSDNCDSLLMRVYRYLIGYLLNSVTHRVFQVRKSSPKSSHVDLRSFTHSVHWLIDHVAVPSWVNLFSTLASSVQHHFWTWTLLRLFHSLLHSKASSRAMQRSTTGQWVRRWPVAFLKGKPCPCNVLAFAFNQISKEVKQLGL